MPLLALPVSHRAAPAVALFGVALVLTQLWWPTRTLDLLALGDVVRLVVVRDVLLVALSALLVVMLRRDAGPPAGRP